MNKLKFRFLLPTCILLILPNFQVLSQNQHLYRFIINKEKQHAKVAFVTLVKEELQDGEYEIEFNISSLPSWQVGMNYYFSREIYLDHLEFNHP